MSRKFRDYDPNQGFLIPPDIRDWVPEGHLARYIDDLVEELDLAAFYGAYRSRLGQPPYHPSMMLKVILYCFCNGVFSSRKIEQATYDNLGARFLSMDQHPDYSSFCNFGKMHEKNISSVFVQVLRLCREMGLASLGHIAIDGSLFKANASLKKAVETKELDSLIAADEALVNELMKKWKATDVEEEAQPEQVPEELRRAESRLQTLRKAKKAIKRRDDERALRAQEAHQQEEQVRQERFDEEMRQYQEAVDAQEGPRLDAASKERGLTYRRLSELTGIAQGRLYKIGKGSRYPSLDEVSILKKALDIEHLSFEKPTKPPTALRKRAVPKPPTQKHVNLTDPDSPVIGRIFRATLQGYNPQLAVDSENQIIVGVRVSNDTTDRANLVPMLNAVEAVNNSRPAEASADSGYYSRAAFRDPSVGGIELYIPFAKTKERVGSANCVETKAMSEKLSTTEGKARMAIRAKTVEPVFGRIKNGLGFTKFLTRGLNSVSREWTLIAITHNLLKLRKVW